MDTYIWMYLWFVGQNLSIFILGLLEVRMTELLCIIRCGYFLNISYNLRLIWNSSFLSIFDCDRKKQLVFILVYHCIKRHAFNGKLTNKAFSWTGIAKYSAFRLWIIYTWSHRFLFIYSRFPYINVLPSKLHLFSYLGICFARLFLSLVSFSFDWLLQELNSWNR